MILWRVTAAVFLLLLAIRHRFETFCFAAGTFISSLQHKFLIEPRKKTYIVKQYCRLQFLGSSPIHSSLKTEDLRNAMHLSLHNAIILLLLSFIVNKVSIVVVTVDGACGLMVMTTMMRVFFSSPLPSCPSPSDPSLAFLVFCYLGRTMCIMRPSVALMKDTCCSDIGID